MSRDTVAAVTSATSLPAINWAMLAQIGVSAGTMYVCTGNRWLTDGVNTYSPVGGFGGVEAVKEESTLFPRAVRMWLSAISSAQLSEPLSENLFNKTVRLYRAVLDPRALTIVGTPQQCFRGYINKVDVHLGDPERGNYYEVEVESRIRREAASNFYSKENLNNMAGGVYSGDTFFDQLPRIAGFTSRWGDKNQELTPLGGGGGRNSTDPIPPRHGGGGRGR